MPRKNSFQILDGGLATQLEQSGYVLNDELWSARLLLEHPDAVLDVHKQFLDAGSDIITSSSYQATVSGFVKIGIDADNAKKLIKDSVRIARQACLESSGVDQEKFVAAGVGPYGAALADGSEYTGNYNLDIDALYDFHVDRWHLLLSAGPDMMLCETIPNRNEIIALSQLAESCSVPVWISCSCQNENSISDGTPIDEIACLLNDSSVSGIGLNCLAPDLVTPLLKKIRMVCPELPLLVYPNSGEEYQVSSKSWTGNSQVDQFIDYSKQWIELGVNIIGGCCRTTPQHIGALKSLQTTNKWPA